MEEANNAEIKARLQLSAWCGPALVLKLLAAKLVFYCLMD